MRLNNIFSQQNSSHLEVPAEDGKICIQFSVYGSMYAVGIENVREIIENHDITPYPKKRVGHLGIISLRGQIIPAIEFGSDSAFANGNEEDAKILILEFQENQAFCLRVQKARRIVIEQSETRQSIANIDNMPVQVLTESDFSHREEAVTS